MQRFWLLFAHFIGDYALQTAYLATTKGTNLWNLFAHSMIYAGCIGVCLNYYKKLSLTKLMIILISHMIIDYIKCRVTAHEFQDLALAIDQLLHITINFGLFYFG